MNLGSSLNCRIEVYSKTKTANSLNETEYSYSKLKSVWAEILPQGGNLQSGDVNTRYANVSHKITIRKNAIPDLNSDMYFTFQGKRYDIEYFLPFYKYNDRIEVFCNLVVE